MKIISPHELAAPSTLTRPALCPVCGESVGADKRRTYCSRRCYNIARQNHKVCVVCGKPFACPPSAATNCCSKACSSQNRANLRARGVYDEPTKRMLAQKEVYYDTHRGALHPNSKYWVIKSPAGEVYECHNLLNFFKTHPELIHGNTPKQAWSGLEVVKQSMLGKRKRNPCYQWRGWTLLDWGD